MDDARIRQITTEVLDKLGERDGSRDTDLHARVAALEHEVAGLRAALARGAGPAAPGTTAVQVNVHPSLQLLSVSPGSSQCVLEPGKPCSDSGQCRTLGH